MLRTVATLEQAVLVLHRTDPADSVMLDMYRNAAMWRYGDS